MNFYEYTMFLPLLLISAIVGKSYAASWSMGSDRFKERQEFLGKTQQRLQLGTDFSKNWGFSDSESMSEVTFVSDPNNFRTLKYRQHYCGIPIYNGHMVVTADVDNFISGSSGRFMEKIADSGYKDCIKVKKIGKESIAEAMVRRDLYNRDRLSNRHSYTVNMKTDKYIMRRSQGKKHKAIIIFMVRASAISDKLEESKGYIYQVDAHTYEIIETWDNIQKQVVNEGHSVHNIHPPEAVLVAQPNIIVPHPAVVVDTQSNVVVQAVPAPIIAQTPIVVENIPLTPPLAIPVETALVGVQVQDQIVPLTPVGQIITQVAPPVAVETVHIVDLGPVETIVIDNNVPLVQTVPTVPLVNIDIPVPHKSLKPASVSRPIESPLMPKLPSVDGAPQKHSPVAPTVVPQAPSAVPIADPVTDPLRMYYKTVGGNSRMSYNYGNDPNGQNLTGLYVATDEKRTWCFLRNRRYDVIHALRAKSMTLLPKLPPFKFKCSAPTLGDKTENGGVSPLADLQFFTKKTLDMFQEWLKYPLWNGTEKLRIYGHVNRSMANAFYMNGAIHVGNGNEMLFPLSTSTIIAHELGHAFTDSTSGLVYTAAAGGLNEALSDLIGIALDYYVFGKLDFRIGEFVFRNGSNGEHLRNMCNQSEDGKSISHVDKYKESLDVHMSSGLFNFIICQLIKTKGNGYDIKTTFRLFMNANVLHFSEAPSFDDIACSLIDSAKHLGSPINSLTLAMSKAGLHCESYVMTNG